MPLDVLTLQARMAARATCLRLIVTNVLTPVPGGDVAAGMRGLVYGITLSNLSATACTVAVTAGAADIAMGPYSILGNDHLQIPTGGLSPLAPIGFFAAGTNGLARCSQPGTNVSLNLYYFAEPH